VRSQKTVGVSPTIHATIDEESRKVLPPAAGLSCTPPPYCPVTTIMMRGQRATVATATLTGRGPTVMTWPVRSDVHMAVQAKGVPESVVEQFAQSLSYGPDLGTCVVGTPRSTPASALRE